MKIKNIIISLILIFSSVFCLSACGENPPPSEHNSNAWFSVEELELYGLQDLTCPDVKKLHTQISDNSSELLFLQGIISSQKAFEQYTQNVISVLNNVYTNTFGFKDSIKSDFKTYVCWRVSKSEQLIDFNTPSKVANVYELYYSLLPLSNNITYTTYNDKITGIKLWNENTTYKIRICYYSSSYENYVPNTLTMQVLKPDLDTLRFYSIFEDSIVN